MINIYQKLFLNKDLSKKNQFARRVALKKNGALAAKNALSLTLKQ